MTNDIQTKKMQMSFKIATADHLLWLETIIEPEANFLKHRKRLKFTDANV